MNTSLHFKRKSTLSLLCLFALMISIARAAETASSEPSPLAPLAFFTAHEWEAKLPDSPDGKKMSIHARFSWAENRQAIRVSNQFIIDGKSKPYVDGIYAWNPQRKVLVFVYTDGDGNFYDGIVRIEESKLVHEFEEIHPDGKVEELLARVTTHGTDSWENAIFARKNGALTPIVQVQYLPVR